ncbi:hypothetical protein RAS1_07730 [Phycisphaerae bacterium RAS1]|nr:hypothetical protein RAS1_07730 [Phycisphaerae bacterium RAS1]
MRRTSPSTLFEIAEVALNATSDDVEARWQEVVQAADGNLAAIDPAVRNAFSVLRVPANLELYRDLLRSCAEETNIPIRDGEADTFVRFCAMCLITPFQHPQQRELFAVCLAGQAVPRWVRYDPRTMSHLRMRWGQRLEQWIQRYLFGGVFQNRSAGARSMIALAYLVVLGVITVGGWNLLRAAALNSLHSDPTTQPAPDARQGKQRLTDAELAARCEHTRTDLQRVEEQEARVYREFEAVAGVSIAEALARRGRRSKELDLAVVRHQSVKEAWTAILAERVDALEIQRRIAALEEIEKRIAAKEVRDADADSAIEAEAWAKSMLERTQRQLSNIDHIRVMLEADRFEQPLDKPDRSKP